VHRDPLRLEYKASDHTLWQRQYFITGHVATEEQKQEEEEDRARQQRESSHWRRPCGRPHTSWLRATDTDVQSVNIGIHSACRKASDHTLWQRIVDTAALHHLASGH